jgi:single-strand DNA-binding protein
MSIATVTVTGFVAIEPKLWFTKQSHTPVVNLRVGATPRRLGTNGEWHEGPSSFFTVNCWRRLAVNVAASVHKGQPILIRGRLKTRTWSGEGKMRSVVEIEADSIGHDISFGWSHFIRGVPKEYQAILDRMGTDRPADEYGGLNSYGTVTGAAPGDADLGGIGLGGIGLGGTDVAGTDVAGINLASTGEADTDPAIPGMAGMEFASTELGGMDPADGPGPSAGDAEGAVSVPF